MTIATLDSFLQKALAYGAGYTMFIWQGGEPTAMGLDFYRVAVSLQEKYRIPGTIVENTLRPMAFFWMKIGQNSCGKTVSLPE